MASKFLQRLAQRTGPLIVLDLEATCSRDETVPKKAMEIIEIGAVVVDETLCAFDSYQAFVRPVRHPTLTDFCRRLTTITQAEVDGAATLTEVTPSFRRWIESTGARLWASWGMFDRLLFAREFAYRGISSPLPATHINLRACFEEVVSPGPVDFQTALSKAGLSFQGQQHRGIDDARNTARLLPVITQRLDAP
jgi:inhibitor of KinA sporulation pathway (predicted exonuclease)